MTDLEMTKLCAEAMGLSTTEQYGMVFDESGRALYDPLHDDAQAMALVKDLRLNVGPIAVDHEPMWAVSFLVRNGPTDWTEHANLNRAIVECVARGAPRG